ncbi:MAG: thiol reductase thioredoxin [Methylotenera sp. 24-45-7]|jgi:thioredoxin 1|nr:MAG: thiol reductase thioredoxin [Methylotenera sp. 24-45-7]OZA08076.1 MAG: thiol reductase thioredoxin [Methylotenera sp. 17-45-7]HQS38460.1 thioredoxin family protein [Methylotenera sp.]HQS43331.1 thioredoxin family protein [Methylotenera sp.]
MNIPSISELSREEINQFTGAVMLEFGAEWCGYCQAAQSIISSELKLHPNIRHIKIEDGKGRRLGRSFTVKLWPTLIFMKNGIELKRLVRQFNSREIGSALNLIY